MDIIKSNRKGFTLIEALLSLTILVSLISTIILPIIEAKQKEAKLKEDYIELVIYYNKQLIDIVKNEVGLDE